MASKKKKKSTRGENKNGYLYLLELSFRHPNHYAEAIPLEGGFKDPLLFFLINFALGSFIGVLIETGLSRSLSLFFLGISQTVFLLPVSLVSLLLISGALHLVAKLLLGKGSFIQSLRATSYSLVYLVLFWIPVLVILSYLLMLYVLTLSFARAHQYSIVKASVNIALPFLISIILSIALGLLNSNSIFTG